MPIMQMPFKKSVPNVDISKIAGFSAVLFISYSFVEAIAAFFSFSMSSIIIFMAALAATCSCLAVIGRKKRVYIYLAAHGALLFLIVLFNVLASGSLRFIGNYFSWLSDSFFGKYTGHFYRELFTVYLFSAVVCWFVYYFAVHRFNVYVILASGLALFISLRVNEMDGGILPFAIYMFFALLSYFTHVYRKNFAKNHADDSKSRSIFYSVAVPVCAAAVAATLIIPVSSNPLELKWLDRQWNRLYDLLKKINGVEYFSLPYAGYGVNEQWLGGNAEPDRSLALVVESPERVLYLRGTIKDFYTGNSWRKHNRRLYKSTEENSALKSDLGEAMNGLSTILLSPQEPGAYFLRDDVKVTFKGLKTKSVFLPSLAERLIFGKPGSVELFQDANSAFSTRRKHGRDFSYSFVAYTPKYYSKSLQDLLRKSADGLYKNAVAKLEAIAEKINGISAATVAGQSQNAITVRDRELGIYSFREDDREYIIVDLQGNKSMSSKQEAAVSGILQALKERTAAVVRVQLGTGEKISPEDICEDVYGMPLGELQSLARRADEIHRDYLQLPGTLPQRVRDLAAEITKDASTNYDKARAIEKYLSENYTYTLRPGNTPEGYDFADHFLFESKAGYNVHYATAMVVLLRSSGIPARYVEGYRLPVNAGDPPVYNMTNVHAHAWPEAYFEGYGWIAFEPSSRYTEHFYKAYTKPAPAPSPSPSPSPIPVEESPIEVGPSDEGEGYQEIPIPVIPGNDPLPSPTSTPDALQNDEDAEEKLDLYVPQPDPDEMEPPPQQDEELEIPEELPEEEIIVEEIEETTVTEKQPKRSVQENLAALFRALLAALLLILRIVLFIAAPVALVASIVFINHVRFRRKISRMTAAEPRKCVLMMYRYFLKLLSLLGFNLDSHETAADFSKRLITNYSGDMNAFAAITDIFMKARYSINEMSEDEKAEYVKFLDYLLSETESRLGKYRFMLMKYILGII